MAFNLENRFPKTTKYFTLLDPGSYQTGDTNTVKINQIPFNSSTPRAIRNEKQLWTHAIYNPEYRKKIQNCPSMMSKQPRFPYENFDDFGFEEIICKCGPDNICTCSIKEENTNNMIKQYECQGKIPKCIFKGPTKHSILGDNGLSVPSKNDDGFDDLPDGSIQRRLKSDRKTHILYNTARPSGFSTDFYRGWKWSKRTSPRFKYKIDESPGPGAYDFKKELDETQLCAEMFRFTKRKKSKQLRFIEMIQSKNLNEKMPGPSDYNPKGLTDSKQNVSFGKCARFSISSTETRPGPANYSLRRDFDLFQTNIVCHTKLPLPAPFMVGSDRFKPQKDFGPSPATYSPKLLSSNFMTCTAAPFGSSARRFQNEFEKYIEGEQTNSDEEEDKKAVNLPHPLSSFKSKTARFKPLLKNFYEPSPADMGPITLESVTRAPHLQKIAPFFSSEGRFKPWNNWLSVFGKARTPGPGYYDMEKFSKKYDAVFHGPLYRTSRFKTTISLTPAPNTYNVGGGIETILRSHNAKLKGNVSLRQNKYSREFELKELTTEEQEWLLLNKSINLLNTQEIIKTTH